MRLTSFKPEPLGAWLAQTLRLPGEKVELHVNPYGWELRCGDLVPFLIEPDGTYNSTS